MGIEAIDKAVEVLGTQDALAAALNIKSPSISEWRKRGVVPPERCAAIEQATNGAVTKSDLRPDLWPPAEKKKPRVADGPKRRAA